VNLFLVAPFDADAQALDAYRRALEPEAARLGVELGTARWDDDHREAKIEVVLDLRPEVVSFTFGCPSAELLRRLRDRGVLSSVTVTSVEEAEEAVARGAGSLTVQGPGAGGHRGIWDQTALPDDTPLLELLSAMAARVDVPLLAGGGIHDSAGVAAVLANGAVAALVGTAYLLADEAGTNQTYRAALADPRFTSTGTTRAFTGRWARGLSNRFMAEHADAPPGYPHLHHLTSPLRRAAISAGDAEVVNLWAGTGHGHVRAGSAADITRSLVP
jgi:nitronate monooxygenase